MLLPTKKRNAPGWSARVGLYVQRGFFASQFDRGYFREKQVSICRREMVFGSVVNAVGEATDLEAIGARPSNQGPQGS